MTSRLAELAGLLRDRTPQGRRGLLACVRDLYLSGADTCTDSVRDGFGLLLRDIAGLADEDARRELSMQLSLLTNPPPALVEHLTNDTGVVAAPLLLNTALLSEDQLVELITSRGNGHAAAIASRQAMSSTMVRHILDCADDIAMTRLAENTDAPIQRADFDVLLDAAPRLPDLQKALLARSDLPADVAVTLMWHVCPQLGPPALERALDVDVDTLALALDTAAARGVIRVSPVSHTQAALSFAAQKSDRNELKEPLIVRLLRDDEMDNFYACLDILTGLDRTIAEAIMTEKSGFALGVACRALNFARSTFSTLARLGEQGRQRGTEQTFLLMSAYEQLDQPRAERLLGYWKTLFCGDPLVDLSTRDAQRKAG